VKILIVCTSDILGGAARGAYRLHRALLSAGVDSRMLVQGKSSDDFTVIGPGSKFEKFINILRPTLDSIPAYFYRNRSKTLFSVSWLPFSNIVKTINKLNPDIVNLHWICGGMMRIEDLSQINAKILWTLQDMWAFTGGCHYDEECGKYENDCGYCRVLNSNRKNDLSSRILQRKRKTFLKMVDPHIVTLSSWLEQCARKSTLLKKWNVRSIPNPIDTDVFKPLNKKAARQLWNLPTDKMLVLFGAVNPLSDDRKGYDKLSGALKILKDRKNIELVVFGSGEPEEASDFGYKIHYLGHLHDEISLVSLYSAVDVMIVPSLQEALGQTATEAMACGTPVVAFANNGLLDIIDHKENGYLAKPFDIVDLAKGIGWILNNKRYDKLSRNARKKILDVFDSRVVADQYIDIFNDILENPRASKS